MKSIEIISNENLEAASECLKCIAHPKRLSILNILEAGEHSVSEIVNLLKISQSLTSDHLRLMEAKGILKSRKEGRRVYYAIAIDELKDILNCIRSKKLKRR